MKKQRNVMTRSEMESRRLEVEKLYRAGLGQAEIVRIFGVSRTTASRWMRRMAEPDGMQLRKADGRPSRISREVLRKLWKTRERWTSREFMRALQKASGVKYHPDHCCRILNSFRAGQMRQGVD